MPRLNKGKIRFNPHSSEIVFKFHGAGITQITRINSRKDKKRN